MMMILVNMAVVVFLLLFDILLGPHISLCYTLQTQFISCFLVCILIGTITVTSQSEFQNLPEFSDLYITGHS